MGAEPNEEVKTGINEGSSPLFVDETVLIGSNTFEIELPINKQSSKIKAEKRRKSDSNLKFIYRTILDI